jgi:arabinan endo-1,5-alpha-L-arabinosidase
VSRLAICTSRCSGEGFINKLVSASGKKQTKNIALSGVKKLSGKAGLNILKSDNLFSENSFNSPKKKAPGNLPFLLTVKRSDLMQHPVLSPMNLNGGSTIREGDKNWHGVGHNVVASFNGIDYIVYYGYDANGNGKPRLRIEKLIWINGWHVPGKQ